MDMQSNERRRFNGREKAALYLAADGVCEGCGAELQPGWHGDHVTPYSCGGKTDLTNGQALCPPCNLKKGTTVTFNDTFKPRRFQQDVIKAVLDGMASGRRVSIVKASPGSGKTLAYQAAATYLHREGLADSVAVFAPRIILARQCETSWMHKTKFGGLAGNHVLFDSRMRMGPIRHVGNTPPLTPVGASGVGFVATYSSLVSSDVVYRAWAEQHRGRFLLVADEAQFCGASDEKDSGTRAGALIEALHEFAAHTLLLTGTPYRSDGAPLILANYGEANEEGKRPLLCHAEASYFDGVADGYLRRFEATMHQIRVRERLVDNTAIEYDLSTNGESLREVLRKEDVYKPIADMVVDAVRDKQKVNPGYRGLISCMEQGDAKRVASYLQQAYPGLRVALAISEDGAEAERALREFQSRGGDVMVTVRKAFIGYDCPQITVVGVLTHYRDWGHLEQLVGRGLRTWNEVEGRSQSCRVIAPDDPAMDKFIDYMRGESEQGLKERKRREEERERAAPGEAEPVLGFVESARTTGARVVAHDMELDNEERVLYEAIKHDIGSAEDVTILAKFAEALRLRAEQPRREEPVPSSVMDETPMTEREQIDEINARVAEVIRKGLAELGIVPGQPGYGDRVAKATHAVNTAPGSMKAGACRTVEDAQNRMAAALRQWQAES
ncbi:HNH endonuclease [Nonomuraea wenchangensis]|uniref:HNH endonuclease n=1 Tax=Nonomuraea wenchangensis TaxID=568860 RepID=UPI0033253288